MQWLLQKQLKIVKDIKEECDQACQYDEQIKESHTKRQENQHNVWEKVESNEIFNEHNQVLKKHYLSENCVGILEAFSKYVLRIIEDIRNLTSIS